MAVCRIRMREGRTTLAPTGGAHTLCRVPKKPTRAKRAAPKKRTATRSSSKKASAKKRPARGLSARKDPKAALAGLKRSVHAMPAFVRAALGKRRLTAKYHARPALQQNDYVGWIVRAKRDETKAKRLAQMLDELEAGDRYMNMRWHPRE
jgi:hypothetical protein